LLFSFLCIYFFHFLFCYFPSYVFIFSFNLGIIERIPMVDFPKFQFSLFVMESQNLLILSYHFMCITIEVWLSSHRYQAMAWNVKLDIRKSFDGFDWLLVLSLRDKGDHTVCLIKRSRQQRCKCIWMKLFPLERECTHINGRTHTWEGDCCGKCELEVSNCLKKWRLSDV